MWFRSDLVKMKPNNKKNYGSDACSLLVIPCHPPVVVIACLDGTIYHAVAMDQDNEMVSFEFFFSLQFIDLFYKYFFPYWYFNFKIA